MPPWFRSLQGYERSLHLRFFAMLLGVVALKDLLTNEVLLGAIDYPNQFVFPFFRVPLLSPQAYVVRIVDWGQVCGCLCALLLMAQRYTCFASFMLLVLYGYAFCANQLSYTNNVYLFLLLLALVTLGAPCVTRPRAPVYPRWMGRILVTIIYATAAITKLTPDWLSGFLLGQAAAHYHYIYAEYIGFYNDHVFQIAAIATIGIELALAVGLWIPRTWPWLAALGLLFHIIIELLLPVRMFSYLMVSSYVLFAPTPVISAVAVRFRWLRRPLTAVGVGVGATLLLTLVFSTLLGAYETPWKCLRALLIAGSILFVICRTGMAQERARYQRKPCRSSQGVLCGWVPAGVVITFAVIQIGLAVKPWLGFTDQFAWRLFTEDLRLQVTLAVRINQGDWQPASLLGASSYWSSRGYRNHWSSWGEQRLYLAEYSRWLVRTYPSVSAAKVIVDYQQNRGSWLQASFLTERPPAQP